MISCLIKCGLLLAAVCLSFASCAAGDRGKVLSGPGPTPAAYLSNTALPIPQEIDTEFQALVDYFGQPGAGGDFPGPEDAGQTLEQKRGLLYYSFHEILARNQEPKSFVDDDPHGLYVAGLKNSGSSLKNLMMEVFIQGGFDSFDSWHQSYGNREIYSFGFARTGLSIGEKLWISDWLLRDCGELFQYVYPDFGGASPGFHFQGSGETV